MPRAAAPKQPALLPVEQGRRPRKPNKVKKALVDLFRESLNGDEGALHFLQRQAVKNPVAFLNNWVKAELAKEFDAGNVEIVVQALHLNATPVSGVLGSPVQGHVMLPHAEVIDAEDAH